MVEREVKVDGNKRSGWTLDATFDVRCIADRTESVCIRTARIDVIAPKMHVGVYLPVGLWSVRRAVWKCMICTTSHLHMCCLLVRVGNLFVMVGIRAIRAQQQRALPSPPNILSYVGI